MHHTQRFRIRTSHPKKLDPGQILLTWVKSDHTRIGSDCSHRVLSGSGWMKTILLPNLVSVRTLTQAVRRWMGGWGRGRRWWWQGLLRSGVWLSTTWVSNSGCQDWCCVA